MKKKKNNKKSNASKSEIINKLIGVFTSSPHKKLNYKQLSALLNIKDSIGRKNVVEILKELDAAGTLKEVEPGKYQLKSKVGQIIGKVDITKQGYAYVVSEEISSDIFVSLKNLNTALHGDTVRLAIYAKKRSSKIEGEVIDIVKRNKTSFVGTLEINRNIAFIIPDSHKMIFDIFIPKENLNNAQHGDKVIAEIEEWYHYSKNPTGKIIEVLGKPGDNEVEMHSILSEHNLPVKFSKAALDEAKKVKTEISDYDLKTRKDFRDTICFTIDPEDAKDFDDALSLKKIDNEYYEVGVHIADVAHYLHEGSAMDKEALERGTSVYLVDRVVPMLPEILSNYVCSLRPNEDKLCFSVVFKININTEIKDVWIGRTIINSNKRFDYKQVQSIIENEKGDFYEEIKILNEIAQNLRKNRFNSGSINFDQNEIKFILNEELKPISVYVKESTEANHLIEEFMLLANKKVAEFVALKVSKDFVYRVHAKPQVDKLSSFTGIINKFGYKLDGKNEVSLSKSMNKLMADISGKPEQNIIESLAIRAMSKAIYSTKNTGHYGLAFKHYSHFTSPIRRYPDVMVHRLLDYYLKNNGFTIQNLEDKCKHCSYKEQQAVMAERASIKFKQAEFLSDKIGQEFSGIISGVTEWGFFVELKENGCEGLVHIRTLTDDFYEYEAENYRIVGQEFGSEYQLGDEVNVKIIEVNINKKQIDFELV